MLQNDIETDETNRLIASNKVEGTNVYNQAGEKLGSIYNFMVDKRTGKVEYAVLQFGGLFGIGSDYYPLPWDVLTYDTRQSGYPDRSDCRRTPCARPARRSRRRSLPRANARDICAPSCRARCAFSRASARNPPRRRSSRGSAHHLAPKRRKCGHIGARASHRQAASRKKGCADR